MFLTKVREKSIGSQWLWVQIVLSTMIFALLAGPAFADNDEDDQPFGATTIIIELTDNDIELQAFVDGVEWKSLQIFAPNGHQPHGAAGVSLARCLLRIRDSGN